MRVHAPELLRAKHRRLISSLERIRFTLNLSDKEWNDLLEVSSTDYERVRKGLRQLPVTSVAKLAERLDLTLEALLEGNIDYMALSARARGDTGYLPEQYRIGARSKRWSSINYLAYIEANWGWKARVQSLRHLQVSDSVFLKPEERINLRFLSDLLEFFRMRGYSDFHFFGMGAHTLITYRNAPFGRTLAAADDVPEMYDLLVNELLPTHIEKNFTYRLLRMNGTGCVIEAVPTPGLAESMGLRQLGSPAVCMTKVGLTASIPGYAGLPYSKVHESKCIHRGDTSCRLEVDFEIPVLLRSRRPPLGAAGR
jgi:hypothetical protein